MECLVIKKLRQKLKVLEILNNPLNEASKKLVEELRAKGVDINPYDKYKKQNEEYEK